MSLSLVSCGGGTPIPPVDKAEDIEQLVGNSMTLDQVYTLMSAKLKNTTTEYPALNVELAAEGNWSFTGTEGGISEDTEAVYLVLIFTPDPIGASYFMVFFEDGLVIGNSWFDYTNAMVIQKLLEGISVETEQ